MMESIAHHFCCECYVCYIQLKESVVSFLQLLRKVGPDFTSCNACFMLPHVISCTKLVLQQIL